MSDGEILMELERRAAQDMPTGADAAEAGYDFGDEAADKAEADYDYDYDYDYSDDEEAADVADAADAVAAVPKFLGVGGSGPVTVLVTGGAGQIAYSLIPHLLNGYVFG